MMKQLSSPLKLLLLLVYVERNTFSQASTLKKCKFNPNVEMLFDLEALAANEWHLDN